MPTPDPTELQTQLEHHSVQNAILRELHGISFLLDDRNQHSDFAPAAVALTDDERSIRRMLDWPVEGGQRYMVPRRGYGGLMAAGADTGHATDLLPANAGRIGGLIVCQAAAVTLYLTGATVLAAGEAVPAIALPVGGQWNFKLGDVLWCGRVCAVGAGGSVSVAEV